MEKDQLAPGTVLAEKYRVESVLGVGGMGTVYRAEHLALRAPVAVKVIDRKLEEGDVTFARFMREAQSAAALRSPHVVQILDYGMDHDQPFMVMELLEGELLADRLKRTGRLTPEETYRIILHVAKAVSKAHEADIVHRDLKPDNIFLVHNEGDELAKVLDFGVAKVEATALDGQGHTRTGSLLGTPYYMSPEQAQGNKDVDGRSDLWALGVIAFECLTGVRPFQSDGLGDLVLQICIRDIPTPSNFAQVPLGFDEWFKHACGREPEERFQSARELAEALRTALGLDVGSAPESRWALPAERVPGERSVWSKAASRGEEISEEADTQRTLQSRPDHVLTPAPSSAVTAHDRTIIDEAPRDRYAASDEWTVVPLEQRNAEAQLAAVLSDDPMGDVQGPSSATRLFWVAILAITFGGGAVFGARELGWIPWGSKQNREPLQVIGAQQVSRNKTKGPSASSGTAPAGEKARADVATKKRSPDPEPETTAEKAQEKDRNPSGDAKDRKETTTQAAEVPPPPVPPPLPEEPVVEPPTTEPGPEPVLPPEIVPAPVPSGTTE